MTKRTARAPRTQAQNGAGPAPVHLVEPMLAGMTTTRQHVLAWVHAHGLAALDQLFREDAVAWARSRHALKTVTPSARVAIIAAYHATIGAVILTVMCITRAWRCRRPSIFDRPRARW